MFLYLFITLIQPDLKDSSLLSATVGDFIVAALSADFCPLQRYCFYMIITVLFYDVFFYFLYCFDNISLILSVYYRLGRMGSIPNGMLPYEILMLFFTAVILRGCFAFYKKMELCRIFVLTQLHIALVCKYGMPANVSSFLRFAVCYCFFYCAFCRILLTGLFVKHLFYLFQYILGRESEFVIEDFIRCGISEMIEPPYYSVYAYQTRHCRR